MFAAVKNQTREWVLSSPENPAYVWHKVYWLVVFAPLVVLAVFDGVQYASFPSMRAPNVSLPVQIVIVSFLWLLLAVIPRVAWHLNSRWRKNGQGALGRLVKNHTVVLAVSGSLYILVLTTALVIMFTPKGWGFRFFYSYGEEWMGNFGIWTIVYAMTAGLVFFIQAQLAKFRESQNGLKKIRVRYHNKLVFLDPASIIWIEAVGNYAALHTPHQTYTLRKTLGAFEKEIAGSKFVRVHRKALVNMAHMQAISAKSGGTYVLDLAGGLKAPLSRRQLSRVKSLLNS